MTAVHPCCVMWRHLCIRPGQQQREVDAVLSGQNGHRFLSVLNVHAIDLEGMKAGEDTGRMCKKDDQYFQLSLSCWLLIHHSVITM